MAKRFFRNESKETCRGDSLPMPLNSDASVRKWRWLVIAQLFFSWVVMKHRGNTVFPNFVRVSNGSYLIAGSTSQ